MRHLSYVGSAFRRTYIRVRVIVLVSNGGVQLLDDTPIGPLRTGVAPTVTVIVPPS